MISVPGHNLTLIRIQRGIKTWCHNSTVIYDPGSQFNVELWPWVKISRWIMTRVIVPHWIMIQILGHNWTFNHDSRSQFNVELRPGVIIQHGIKTWGYNSTEILILSVGGVVIQWPPVSEGRNSTWKIRWILSAARWIKTPRVEIQWGQNSILHRRTFVNIFFFSWNFLEYPNG